jgi:lipoate-protein ligase A
MWIDDQILRNYKNQLALKVFIPDFTAVVLGSSNQPDIEVSETWCETRGIPVLKRYGGGGTVVLYPGCVVISAGMWVRQQFQNQDYFRRLNQSVINVLAGVNGRLAGLDQRGLSDIAFNGRKIAGTSLFRSRNYLLYQGSLLVEPDLDLINNCLKHPSKEPDYRAGRSHGEFMTSLSAVAQVTVQEVFAACSTLLAAEIKSMLADELIEPVVSQFPALQARLDRSAGNSSVREP